MSSRRILLVEDEFIIRAVLGEALADAGCNVTEAASAVAAEALLDHPDGFHGLVTDVQMPGGSDGVTLARHFQARHPDAVVLFMTGRPDSLAAHGALTTRQALLVKPFGPEELLRTLLGLLER